MSENLDVVRSIYAAWERGDFSRTEWAHRDLELVWADGPSPTTWSGLSGAEAGWREFLGTWQDYRVHPEHYFAPDDERVLVLVRFTARGKTSGVEVGESGARGANLFHILDGLVRRLVLYWDRDRALADLGLEASAVSQDNVERVRAALEAFNRRDGAAFDALLARNAEIVPVRAAVEQVTYEGANAGSQYFAAVDERWENARWEVEDIRDGGAWVLALGYIRGRGRDSGATFDARAGWVAHLDEGLITRFQTFSDRSAALKAVGLEEG